MYARRRKKGEEKDGGSDGHISTHSPNPGRCCCISAVCGSAALSLVPVHTRHRESTVERTGPLDDVQHRCMSTPFAFGEDGTRGLG